MYQYGSRSTPRGERISLLSKAKVDKVVRARQRRDLAHDRGVLTVLGEPIFDDARVERQRRLRVLRAARTVGGGRCLSKKKQVRTKIAAIKGESTRTVALLSLDVVEETSAMVAAAASVVDVEVASAIAVSVVDVEVTSAIAASAEVVVAAALKVVVLVSVETTPSTVVVTRNVEVSTSVTVTTFASASAAAVAALVEDVVVVVVMASVVVVASASTVLVLVSVCPCPCPV